MRFVVCYGDGVPTTVDNAIPYQCSAGSRIARHAGLSRYASRRCPCSRSARTAANAANGTNRSIRCPINRGHTSACRPIALSVSAPPSYSLILFCPQWSMNVPAEADSCQSKVAEEDARRALVPAAPEFVRPKSEIDVIPSEAGPAAVTWRTGRKRRNMPGIVGRSHKKHPRVCRAATSPHGALPSRTTRRIRPAHGLTNRWGVAVGWALHAGSFCDRMPLVNEQRDVVSCSPARVPGSGDRGDSEARRAH